MPLIHVILVAFDNTARLKTRWLRDILPALREMPNFGYFLSVVDNSPHYSDELAAEFGRGSATYLWNRGENKQYGGAINAAVADDGVSDYTLYVCASHGLMIDPGWIRDLVQPMIDDQMVAMTGHLRGSNSPAGVAHDTGQEWIKEKYRFTHEDGTGHVPQHVQGGVWAGRTSVMREHPYIEPLMHLYSDHYITWELLKAGFKCADVPSVLSVWREVATMNEARDRKFIHDCREG